MDVVVVASRESVRTSSAPLINVRRLMIDDQERLFASHLLSLACRSPAARLPLTLRSPTALLIVSLVLPFLPFACRSPFARLPLDSRSPPPTLHLSAFRDAVTVASHYLLPYSENRASPVILGYPIWKSAVAKWRQMGEWGFFSLV